jgi:gluconolactonase
MQEALMRTDEFVPFADGLDHPECVAWGPDGYVYAGGEAGQIYRITLDTGAYEEIACTGGFTLGVTLDGRGNIYTCNSGLHKVVCTSPDGRQVTVYSEGTPARKMRTPNYAVFDHAGNLWVSDSGEFLQFNGCLFCIHPGGQTEMVNDQVTAFPNGMALGPDGNYLYIILSNGPGVVRVRITPDGRASAAEPVVDLPGTVPDGLAFDENGNLYISCYAPNYIYRLSPAGKLDLIVSDWMNTTLPAPTNLAFCGPDRRTLVTAGLSRWHICKARVDTAGLPLVYPGT